MLNFMLKTMIGTVPLLLGTAATAQEASYRDLASLGGAMQAVAEACGGYSAAELAQMKQEQRQIATRGGTSPAEFERAFKAGHASGKAKIAGATPARKQKMCNDVRAMAGK